MTLDEHDLEPAVGQPPSADLAGRARSDDDDVGVAHRRDLSRSPLP